MVFFVDFKLQSRRSPILKHPRWLELKSRCPSYISCKLILGNWKPLIIRTSRNFEAIFVYLWVILYIFLPPITRTASNQFETGLSMRDKSLKTTSAPQSKTITLRYGFCSYLVFHFTQLLSAWIWLMYTVWIEKKVNIIFPYFQSFVFNSRSYLFQFALEGLSYQDSAEIKCSVSGPN